ncbi:MAG: ion transporter [Bacteroidota bacterium]|nr:ion transporter [Candidatus Kapabacteria bacterium]MDW8219388.1 ion transporter [Bacteroidota bacterium]
MHTLKHRIYAIVSVSEQKGDVSWLFDVFIITLIFLNTLAMILESIPSLHASFSQAFHLFDTISVAIFSIEYLARVWTANIQPEFSRPVLGNIRYALTPLAIVDLVAILPFYLPFLGVDLRSLRILRIFRVFRVFKIARYVRALNLISAVLRKKREELVLSLAFTFFLLLITSSLVYYVENEAQPDKFASIPETMWWGIATLTTVGYGDMYPITGLGKFLGGIIAILSVGIFALPAGILASGFSEVLSLHKHYHTSHTSHNTTALTCPHCGKVVSVELRSAPMS